MDTTWILGTLAAHKVISAPGEWTLDAAAGGLNSRVFHARRDGRVPELTVRLARPDQSFAHEARALGEVAGCPGVPKVLLVTERLLVHQRLPGAPAPLAGVDDSSLLALAGTLACLHRASQGGYTRWPESIMVAGTRADLFRYRLGSLTSYDAYEPAIRGEVDSRLPGLIERLASLDLDASSWSRQEFARLHGDLSIGNILWSGGGVGLIDWEYSRIGDPAEDLAYLLTEQPAPQETAGTLRRGYEQSGGDPATWQRVPAYAAFTAVDSTLWWVDYIERHNLTESREQVETRIATAADWLAGDISNQTVAGP